MGSLDAIDSDAFPLSGNPSIGVTDVITLSPGEVNRNVDAGLIQFVG